MSLRIFAQCLWIRTGSSQSNKGLGKRSLVALEEAAAEGKGAAQLDGRMIDAASARMAENVVAMDDAIQSKAQG